MQKLTFLLAALTAGALMLASANAAGPASKSVAIVHVQKGCHVWSLGHMRNAKLHLTMHRGDRLSVLNQDLDMHKLMQVSGPSVSTGAFMMTSQRVLLHFTKPGLYRFHTRVADMRGMPEAETIGHDNQLVLTVLVR